jgi:16S rRNA G966 N2-methylase RsmD
VECAKRFSPPRGREHASSTCPRERQLRAPLGINVSEGSTGIGTSRQASNRLVPLLSQDEARRLTEEVKRDVRALWVKLDRLYGGGAHRALGYASWHQYCREEFRIGSKSRAYELLDAGRVTAALARHSDTSELPKNDRQAKALAPLLRRRGEAEVVAAWRELSKEYGDAVTADVVRRTVKRYLGRKERETRARTRGLVPVEFEKSGFDIRHCSIQDLELDAECVDLIFTDPPYSGRDLDLWSALARTARHVLRPSRLLVTYSGSYYLPEVIDALSAELEWVWLGAHVHSARKAVIVDRRVYVGSKPILFFARAPYEPRGWIQDTVAPAWTPKDEHPWQQSVDAAITYVKGLTKPGEVILDPFLGTGTTALAVQSLGSRSFIGCDSNGEAVATTRRRLAETSTESPLGVLTEAETSA